MNGPFRRSTATVVVISLVIATACTTGQGAQSPAPASRSVATISEAPSASTTPDPSATPTAMPSPTAASPGVLREGEPTALVPGRYFIDSRHWGVLASSEATYPKLSFTVPVGWSGNSTLVGKTPGPSGEAVPFLWAWNFGHGYKDPCTDHTPVVPAAGSGTAGLLRVIAGQPGIDAGPITDVIVGGHDGSYVEYVVTTDRATCGNGQEDLVIWGECPAPVTIGCEGLTGGARHGAARYGATKGDRERAYAIDVDGTTYTFFTNQPVDLPAADQAELQQVLDSIEFQPAS